MLKLVSVVITLCVVAYLVLQFLIIKDEERSEKYRKTKKGKGVIL